MTVSAAGGEAQDVEGVAGRTAGRLDDSADVRGPEDGAVIEAGIGQELRVAHSRRAERPDEREEKAVGRAGADPAEDVESRLRHDRLRDGGGRCAGIFFETESGDAGHERRGRG